MPLDQIVFIIPVIVFAAIIVAAILIRNIFAEVPEDKREYMDPLPPALRLIWPVIQLIAYYVGPMIPASMLDGMNNRLNLSGLAYMFNPYQFFGLKVFAAICFTILAVASAYAMKYDSPDMIVLALVGGFLLGYMLPEMSLSDARKRRQKEILKTLPVFLDYITLTVESGANFSTALAQAVDKGPPGVLQHEFRHILRDMRAGVPRAEALLRMDERVRLPSVTAFISAVIQAERLGASLGATLKAQSQQRREERFLRAEKLAMEAPVKMIFPLVAFIFPITFGVLAFLIYMKWQLEVVGRG